MPQYKFLFTDDATTTLAAGIVAASTSLQVVSGGGALFPALGAGQAFIVTLIKNGNPAIKEVIRVAGRSGDNFTNLTRNFSGTGALTWNAGDTVAMLQPAEAMAVFAQIIDLQSQSPNYANDTGSANNYSVALSPPLNGHVIGMPIRWIAAHSNTGPSDFNDGISVAELLTDNGAELLPNEVIGGLVYEAVWNGATYQLTGRFRYDFSKINGQVSNAQVPVGAVVQWEASLVINFTQMAGQLHSGQMVNDFPLPGSPTTTTQSVGDATSKLATTAFVNPSSVLGSYRKSPDGNIDQWGLCNPNGGTISVTFPIAFPSACDNLVFGQISSGPTQAYSPPGTVSRTGFNVANTGGQTYWRARGH